MAAIATGAQEEVQEKSQEESQEEAQEDEKKEKQHEQQQKGVHKGGTLPKACAHYPRQCSLVAPCCGEVFPCRFCHDEEKGKWETKEDLKKVHKINRHDVSEIVCRGCGARQAKSDRCCECGQLFARYSCMICSFYDDTEGKNIFHCDGCGICRVGLREEYRHCDKCGICVPIDSSHTCAGTDAAKADCPVCLEDCWSSMEPATWMRCGHYIHSNCLTELYRASAFPRCPICQQSLLGEEEQARMREAIEMEIAMTQMPEEYANFTVTIHCNDCNLKSEANFHIVAMKCAHCDSFNTRRD
eukprot:g3913.t1